MTLTSNVEIANWKPELGIARMTSYALPNEPCFWLMQVRVTPYNASKAGVKYEPASWQGRPLIRVIWLNRDGHLAEFQQWLEDGEEVSVPSGWGLTVDEAVDCADEYSHLGVAQSQEWALQAQEESTLIEDVIESKYQLAEMVNNRSQFGPAGKTQRNGFPQPLRQEKLLESARSWK